MTTETPLPLTVVTGLSTRAAAITAGFVQNCVLTTAGGAECWGYNADGELGNGTTTDNSSPCL